MSLTDVMSAAGLSSWTELALILCLVAFAAIVVWVFFIRNRPSYDHLRNLPLEGDNGAQARSSARGGNKS
jgi:cbb3-type cytochrome oxidase subunit 3